MNGPISYLEYQINIAEVGARFMAESIAAGGNVETALEELRAEFDGFYTLLVSEGAIGQFSQTGLHALGGLRHFLWDTTRGLEIWQVNVLSWLTVIGSITLSFVVWGIGLWLRGAF